MAYNVEEQEQLAALKGWWADHGTKVTVLVTAIAFAVAGWQGWRLYTQNQGKKASAYYEQLTKAVTAKDAAKVKELTGTLSTQFGGTSIAHLGSLQAAKFFVESGDLKSAQERLEWSIANSKDEEYKALARLRLAGILLDQKQFDAALAALNQPMPEAFAIVSGDRKGDVLMAMNKPTEAKAAYKAAYDMANKEGEQNPLKQTLQIKLDSLGGA